MSATGAERVALTGHTASVNACAVSPDGTWIISASSDTTLKIWDIATGAERTTLTGHIGELQGCGVCPDGAWIISAGGISEGLQRHGALKIWDAATGTEQTTLTGFAYQMECCAVSPDGAWIVFAGGDGVLKIWDAATGTQRDTLTAPHSRGTSMCGEPGWRLDRLGRRRRRPQDLGCRHRRRTVHPQGA